MKTFIRKIRRIKKRKALSRVITLIAGCYAFKSGIINQQTDLLMNSNPQSLTINNQKTYTIASDDYESLIESQSVNSSRRVITGSGNVFEVQSEALESALESRGGELGKSSPGARAKSEARRNVRNGKFSRHFRSGSTLLPGADGFVPQKTYCRYHDNVPLSCKPKIKLSDTPFQDDGNNGQPPGEFDASKYKGGPNPFLDKFNYDNPEHTRESTDFSNKKRVDHAFDRHAEKCFNIKENKNKQTKELFVKKNRGVIESPETERINGSYRYETPAYIYREKDGNLVTIVNATNNSFITTVNATESQLDNLQETKNFGLDTRPSMQLTLRLRGPKP